MSQKTKASPAPKTPAPPAPLEMSPHSVEAEEAVLGASLINPDGIYEISSFLKPDDFFIVRNGWIWEAMIRILGRKENVDYVTVVDQLRGQNRLEGIGGESYITYLLNHTPASLYAETYGRIVQRAAIRRRLLNAGSQIAKLAYDGDIDINDVVSGSQQAVDDALAHAIPERTMSIRRAAENYLDELSQTQAAESLLTGFVDVDDLLGGLKPGDLMIVAGRPGMGKTSWLLSALLNIARKIKADNGGQYVFHASMEMDNNQLIQRLIAMLTTVSVRDQRSTALPDDQWESVINAVAEISQLPVIFDDRSGMTVKQLRAACKRSVRLYGPLKAVIVDYVGLMSIEPDVIKKLNLNNSVAMHSYISRSLKELARDLQIPVIAAAQLNREVEKRRDKRPKLSDLRDSGSYEQDADAVCFLYRDEVYNENTERPNEAELILAKYRHGPTGMASLYFDKPKSMFGNLTRRTYSLNDIPNAPQRTWVGWQSNRREDSSDG